MKYILRLLCHMILFIYLDEVTLFSPIHTHVHTHTKPSSVISCFYLYPDEPTSAGWLPSEAHRKKIPTCKGIGLAEPDSESWVKV